MTSVSGESGDDSRVSRMPPATVRADLRVFSEGAVLRAAHRLTDFCFVSLTREGDHLEVRMDPMSSAAVPETLQGRFGNLLLDEELRDRIGRETEAERRLIIAHALSRHAVPRGGAPPCENRSLA